MKNLEGLWGVGYLTTDSDRVLNVFRIDHVLNSDFLLVSVCSATGEVSHQRIVDLYRIGQTYLYASNEEAAKAYNSFVDHTGKG